MFVLHRTKNVSVEQGLVCLERGNSRQDSDERRVEVVSFATRCPTRRIGQRWASPGSFSFGFQAAILKEPFWVEVLNCERLFDEYPQSMYAVKLKLSPVALESKLWLIVIVTVWPAGMRTGPEFAVSVNLPVVSDPTIRTFAHMARLGFGLVIF